MNSSLVVDDRAWIASGTRNMLARYIHWEFATNCYAPSVAVAVRPPRGQLDLDERTGIKRRQKTPLERATIIIPMPQPPLYKDVLRSFQSLVQVQKDFEGPNGPLAQSHSFHPSRIAITPTMRRKVKPLRPHRLHYGGHPDNGNILGRIRGMAQESPEYQPYYLDHHSARAFLCELFDATACLKEMGECDQRDFEYTMAYHPIQQRMHFHGASIRERCMVYVDMVIMASVGRLEEYPIDSIAKYHERIHRLYRPANSTRIELTAAGTNILSRRTRTTSSNI